MKLKKFIAILPLIAVLSLAFGQDETKLHSSAQERHELEVQKHRTEVLHALLTIPNLQTPFDFLTFGIQGPTVVLLGFTVQPVLKTQAEGVIRQLPWVQYVVNRIEVLPLNPEDKQIRVQSLSILNELVPQAFPSNHADIRIKTMRGDVTLVGFIDEISKLRLESAIVQIQHRPYVREVTNNVIIRPKE
jgi:hypothetical protein